MKRILMAHEAPGARPVPQLWDTANASWFVPAHQMLLIAAAVGPVFVKVAWYAKLDVPTAWLRNEIKLVERCSVAGLQVPVRAMACGEWGASSVIVTVAAAAPIAVGRKRTLIAQDAAAANCAPQLFELANRVGFAPVTTMLRIVSAEPPVFVKFT